MTTTRSFCPLCNWHHDQADFDPTVPQPFASEPAPEGVDPLVWGYSLGRTLVVEEALKAHLETHELIEWVTALQAAKQRAVSLEAEHAAYEESVVGALNERNTRDCQRAEQAEVELAENTSVMQALRRQRDQAEASIRHVENLHHRYRDVEALGDDDSCAHCNQLAGHRVPWPCPTLQALEQP